MRIYMSARTSAGVGDMFTDRMKDAVHALGYEVERVNVHKAGRELDITGTHRLEKRKVVVECKAQKKPIGGADINKFVGVLDAERGLGESAPQGYFVSVGGFTQTARQQEEDTGRLRCVLVGPTELSEVLTAAGVMAPAATVWARVGNLVEGLKVKAERLDVIASDRGWFYLAHLLVDSVSRRCVCYADGAPLRREATEELLGEVGGADLAGDFGDLLTAPSTSGLLAPALMQAETAYRQYLVKEYGVVRHEGMPADAKLGTSTPLRLEELYVPARLVHLRDADKAEEEGARGDAAFTPRQVDTEAAASSLGVSEALVAVPHLSILGPPGAGKSTLVKRLAVAYADGTRRAAVDDDLPEMQLLPIVLRCREIGLQQETVHDALEAIPRWAEIPQHVAAFRELLYERLNAGAVLLLVDGLDEIADSRLRMRFCAQLRSFLSTYPSIRLVVTSRDAGFRLVAGAMGEFTEKYRLAELSNEAIEQLTLAWSRHVHGADAKDVARARQLSASITSNWRLQRLASTPLLLTMLLVVQQWGGGQELPKRRNLLYRRAVEVLLNTWNVEAHDPINMDEALPQLAYLAARMTMDGDQKVSHKRLLLMLTSARSDMPDVLAYCKDSPSDFVNLVEMRSSLLLHAGYLETDDGVQPAYEFRHLMFQEYLAALALTEEWTPERDVTLVDWLGPHLAEESWGEVVQLASVLAGRRAEALLTEMHAQFRRALARNGAAPAGPSFIDGTLASNQLMALLYACMADDAQVSPDAAEPILYDIGKYLQGWSASAVKPMLDSRYADQFRRLVLEGLVSADASHFTAAAFGVFVSDRSNWTREVLSDDLAKALNSEDVRRVNSALAVIMSLAFSIDGALVTVDAADVPMEKRDIAEVVRDQLDRVVKLAEGSSGASLELALWALCWASAVLKLEAKDLGPLLLGRMAELVVGEPGVAHFAGWLAVQTRATDYTLGLARDVTEKLDATLADPSTLSGNQRIHEGAMILAHYAGVRTLDELEAHLAEVRRPRPSTA